MNKVNLVDALWLTLWHALWDTLLLLWLLGDSDDDRLLLLLDALLITHWLADWSTRLI